MKKIFLDEMGMLKTIWFALVVFVAIIAIATLIGWSSDDICKENYGQDFRYSFTLDGSCTNSNGEIRAF